LHQSNNNAEITRVSLLLEQAQAECEKLRNALAVEKPRQGPHGETERVKEEVGFLMETTLSSRLSATRPHWRPALAWSSDSAENAMLHLIVRPEDLTVVLDNPDTAEMKSILNAIHDLLWSDMLAGRGEEHDEIETYRTNDLSEATGRLRKLFSLSPVV
jgi:hypothetical protein